MLERYNRQIILDGIGIEGQKKIKNSSVLLVGVGGLGSVISLYLTAAGIGRIGIVDFDVVSISNLQRQILYKENDVGLSKVLCAKKRLNELNSEVIIDAYDAKFDLDNADELVKKYDIVVDGCDNFATRYLIDVACERCGKPYVFGAIGEFSGQVSVFDKSGVIRYRDLFSDESFLTEKNRQVSGVFGVLPGIIGNIEANEVLKIITGVGDTLSNRLFSINLLTMETNTFDLQ